MVNKKNYKFYFWVVVFIIGVLSYSLVKLIATSFTLYDFIPENYILIFQAVLFVSLIASVFNNSKLQLYSFKKLNILKVVSTPDRDAIILTNGIVLVGMLLWNFLLSVVSVNIDGFEPLGFVKYLFLLVGIILIAEVLIFQILLTLVTSLVLNLKYSLSFYSSLIPTVCGLVLYLPLIVLTLWLGSMSFGIQTESLGDSYNSSVAPSTNIRSVPQDNIFNYISDGSIVKKCQPLITAENFNQYFIFPDDGVNGIVFWGNHRTGDLVWYTSRFENPTKEDFLPNSKISSANLCIIDNETSVRFSEYLLVCQEINKKVVCKDNYKPSVSTDKKTNKSGAGNVKNIVNKVDNSLMNEMFRKGGVSYE